MRGLRLLAPAAAALAVSCSVGDGTGEVRGWLRVPVCNVDDPRYSMAPDFFGGDWYQGSLLVRVARGGSTGEYNDELVFVVDDTGYVARHLNERLPVGPPGVTPVHAALRLSRTCGSRQLLERVPNVALPAVRGYVVFEAIYRGDPNADAAARRTAVAQFSLEMLDTRVTRDTTGTAAQPGVGEGREPPVVPSARAELEGAFEFYFARGRPAQRFQ